MTARLATLDAHGDRIEIRAGNEVPIVVALPLADTDEATLTSALKIVFAADHLTRVQQVDVRLHAPLVQLRALANLPPVGPRDLARLVENQVDRFFRPVGGEVVVAAEWDSSRERTVARAAVGSLELVERLERSLTDCGRRVRGFLPANGEPVGRLQFVTPLAHARRRARSTAMAIVSVVVASSGWFVAGATYLLDLYADERSLAFELAQLQEPLARIDALMARVSDFAPVAEAVRRQSEGSAWVTARLGGVNAALPADTHLHRFTASRDGTLHLTAHGPDALDAVESLDAWWSGTVRLDGTPEVLEEEPDTARTEQFAIVLEAYPP